ncbi:1,4-dihydroxy-2-naphthoate octaprenyltransferase [Klebsiella pneumoniae]|nr:1,4-dihydroxy-2-naphthoate octaprenyltransferase [Klebsiella pneumoniae]
MLQILSNLANDYGDAVKGAINRIASGRCADAERGDYPQQMKRALIVTVVLICLFGLALLCAAWQSVGDFIGFLALGGLSIVAAITYTVGTRPYGYIGLGDISVLVFFGWLSVLGSWYLQAHNVEAAIFLPATACGLLATAVLNINNLRDIDSDRQNGKNTSPCAWARSMPAAIMPACCSAPCCVWRCLTCWRCIQPGLAVYSRHAAAGETGALRPARIRSAGDAANARKDGQRGFTNQPAVCYRNYCQ